MVACRIVLPRSVPFFSLYSGSKNENINPVFFQQKNIPHPPPFTESWDLNTLTAISTWAKNSGFDKNYGWHLLREERVKNGP